MIKVLWSLVPLLTALSCYSAGGDGDGDGNSGGTAGRGSGGSTARGGSGGETCGQCPAAACPQAVTLNVAADPMVAPANLSKIVVEGAGVTFDCYAYSDCSAGCQSLEYMLPDGHYAVDITATGFEPTVLEFDIVNPTNCGCCGCCPGVFVQQLTLSPDGSALETCCADLNRDAMNCGSCDAPCDVGATCVEGSCQPGP